MEQAFVEPLPFADREEAEVVPVVPDEQDPRVDLLAVDAGMEAVPVACDLQQAANACEREQPSAQRPASMRRSAPSVSAASSGERVVAVEPDVPGEVVAGPKGDADERSVRGEGDRGDRGEGAVAACDAENRSARAARGLAWILALLQEMHLYASLARRGGECLGCRPPPPDRGLTTRKAWVLTAPKLSRTAHGECPAARR